MMIEPGFRRAPPIFRLTPIAEDRTAPMRDFAEDGDRSN